MLRFSLPGISEDAPVVIKGWVVIDWIFGLVRAKQIGNMLKSTELTS